MRNLLVACWDVLVDSLAEQPTLSPILLRNFRKIMRKWYGPSLRLTHISQLRSLWMCMGLTKVPVYWMCAVVVGCVGCSRCSSSSTSCVPPRSTGLSVRLYMINTKHWCILHMIVF